MNVFVIVTAAVRAMALPSSVSSRRSAGCRRRARFSFHLADVLLGKLLLCRFSQDIHPLATHSRKGLGMRDAALRRSRVNTRCASQLTRVRGGRYSRAFSAEVPTAQTAVLSSSDVVCNTLDQ